MEIIEALIREIEEKPELAAELWRKITGKAEAQPAAQILAELAAATKAIEKQGKEQVRLREDFNKMLKRMDRVETLVRALDRSVKGIGARWGILSEKAFRNAIEVASEIAGVEVSRWVEYEEGLVYKHPSQVEADLAVRDREHMLIEVKASISVGNIAALVRKGELYYGKRGVKPILAVVTPYIREDAKALAEKLGVKVYTT